jgi:hypothetical protein
MRLIPLYTGALCLLLSAQGMAVGVATGIEKHLDGERQARMAELDFMVGIWDLTRRESVAEGQSIQWSGTRSCVWVLNRTAIRCDDRLSDPIPLESPHDRATTMEQLFYVTYNESHASYELLYMDALSAERSVYAASFDQSSQSLLTVSSDRPSGVDNAIVNAIQIRIDDNQIREQLQLLPAGSEQLESVETILRRKTGNPRDELFF